MGIMTASCGVAVGSEGIVWPFISAQQMKAAAAAITYTEQETCHWPSPWNFRPTKNLQEQYKEFP